MKYLRNPITSEVKSTTPLEAKKLLRYGWVLASAAEHHLYHREVVKAVVERMAKVGERHRRLH